MLTETNAAGETTTHRYDRRLRRIETENPLRQITRMEYDGRGLLTTRTAPNSPEHVWTLAYDTAGRLESVSDPETNTTSYGYDLSDNLVSVTEPGGGITTFAHDALNRRTRKQTADVAGQPSQVWAWTLDPEGNALVEARPDGSTATHTYDALNRRLTSAYAGAPVGSPESRTYTWDANSNLTRISETTGGQTVAVETQYDVHNRPVQLTDAWNRVWTQAFDDADQRVALTSPGVPGVQWIYDAGSRPVQINVEGAGAYAFSYDLADRNTGITHPNATETTHRFDAASRIIEIRHDRAGLQTGYQYSYDANGNRTHQTETHGNQTIASSFAYDKADRLTAITEPNKYTAYTLDGSGNRIEVREGTSALTVQRKYTATFNTRNQITQQRQHDNGAVIATTDFHYDPNGNLIRQIAGSNQTEWRYDILDRLIETTPPTGPPTLYQYGPSDVRIAKIRNGEEIRYHYDGERITLETNTLGNPQRHYVYSAAGLLNTTIFGTTPQHRSAHLDAMGSPVLITGSDGSVLTRTRFDAWGVEQSLFGVRDHAIAFQGYWSGIELEETGTLLSAARLYIPSLGIFAERDPVEGNAPSPITFNPYLIGRGNPNYWMDPDGRYAEAGHYYTTYYVAMMAGYSHPEARQLAFYSQLPDEADELDAIGVQIDALTSSINRLSRFGSVLAENAGRHRDMVQTTLHALTSLRADYETERTAQAIVVAGGDLMTTGLLIHRLGDTFAHRTMDSGDDPITYDTGMGHAHDGTEPDVIQVRPELYDDYVRKLAGVLAEKRGLNKYDTIKLVDNVSRRLGDVRNIERMIPGTDSPRKSEDLNTMSINAIKRHIEFEGGDLSYEPEGYPGNSGWKLVAPFIGNSIEAAVGAASQNSDLPRVERGAIVNALRKADLLIQESSDLELKRSEK